MKGGLMADIEKDFVHIVKYTLENKTDDYSMLLRKTLPKISRARPDLKAEISDILEHLKDANPIRSINDPLPVDLDSRLELLKRENEPSIDIEPVWSPELKSVFDEIIHEREIIPELARAGIIPTKSLLFVGAPGTGKSLAARWLARRLNYPLLTLDLSAVISSFLGRTGNNIRVVLDYARRGKNVLLLDEFDAIAKRRDDLLEVGELKRLVTVLLQEIESWPQDGLLIAATNHPDLLDRAVWRRFDRVVEFNIPNKKLIEETISRVIQENELDGMPVSYLIEILFGSSYADIIKVINSAKRSSILRKMNVNQSILETTANLIKGKTTKEKMSLAVMMNKMGMSQRHINQLTGLSRDTLRSHINQLST
jgi:SpoVK/Ycf46/Vps4 family AAA+-type ATPase